MKKFRSHLVLVMVLAFTMLLAACSSDSSSGTEGGESSGGSEGTQNLSLLTGGTGGTYYPLGGQIAEVWNDNAGVNVTAQTSGASAENMETLKNGDAEVAFSQTDIATYALKGEEMFEGKAMDNFQAIATLYPETVQLVTTEKTGIKSVEDLKGKKVSVGDLGSGVNINAKQILEIHGLSFEDIQAQNLPFDSSVDEIQAGNLDAAFITAGTPTAAVETLAAQDDVVVVSISADKIKELQEKYPFYAEDVIPAGTYTGVDEDVTTVAVKAMIVASKDLSEDLVYEMTKSLFGQTDKITHAKGELIKVETGLDGVGDIEVHPGAQKYYDEKGVSKE